MYCRCKECRNRSLPKGSEEANVVDKDVEKNVVEIMIVMLCGSDSWRNKDLPHVSKQSKVLDKTGDLRKLRQEVCYV